MAIYLKNKELKRALIESKEKDELTSEALEMIQLMVKRLSTKFSYEYPEDREDCASVAIMDVIQYWRGYNPETSPNAFAYFTTMIINGMGKGWRKLNGNGKFPKSKKIRLSQSNIYNI
jgi:DNA-directed RNA polymerase specialized sigma subunit